MGYVACYEDGKIKMGMEVLRGLMVLGHGFESELHPKARWKKMDEK
jgi:hypothetical protein